MASSVSASGTSPQALPAAPAAGTRRRGGGGGAGSLQLYHLYYCWLIMLFEFHFFVGSVVGLWATGILVNLAFPPMLLMLLFQIPRLLQPGKSWMLYMPLLAMVIVAGLGVPLAANRTLAKTAFQLMLIYYCMAVSTVLYVKTARQAIPILALLVGQFVWYAMFGAIDASVEWHPTLANQDGYGGIYVMAVGLCYWIWMSREKGWFKWLLLLLAGYCVLAVVASYARGAFLALVALGGWIWLRSPRKGLTLLAAVAAALVVVIGASLVFDPGFFYNEIMSSFTEGTEEGTGAQRWNLWMTALKVWTVHPIIGVGVGNFGAFAATYFQPGQLEAFPNPSVLYGFNLHNAFFQILSELGIVGTIAFALLQWDFFKRNRDLKKPIAAAVWKAQTGGRFDLKYVALAMEAANVANLLTAFFYASLMMPWFWSVWMVNRMLWSVTRPTGPMPPPQAAPRPSASAARGRRLRR